MKITDQKTNSSASESRQAFQSSTPSNGNPAINASDSDNSPVMMNTPGLKPRGYRADQLIDMANDDGYRLSTEAPRHDKMVG